MSGVFVSMDKVSTSLHKFQHVTDFVTRVCQGTEPTICTSIEGSRFVVGYGGLDTELEAHLLSVLLATEFPSTVQGVEVSVGI